MSKASFGPWNRRDPEKSDESNDITKFESTMDIFKSGKFTPEERKEEYRRRGKSPSGVIDGVYSDLNLENGGAYSDLNRDWDADA